MRELHTARKERQGEKKEKADGTEKLSEGQMNERQVIGRIAENTAEARSRAPSRARASWKK